MCLYSPWLPVVESGLRRGSPRANVSVHAIHVAATADLFWVVMIHAVARAPFLRACFAYWAMWWWRGHDCGVVFSVLLLTRGVVFRVGGGCVPGGPVLCDWVLSTWVVSVGVISGESGSVPISVSLSLRWCARIVRSVGFGAPAFPLERYSRQHDQEVVGSWCLRVRRS